MAHVVAYLTGLLGGEGLKVFLKKTIVMFALLSFLAAILSMFVLPALILPNSIFNVLIGSELTMIFKAVDFFIPLPFIMSCFILIMSVRIFSFFWSFILWFFNAFKDGVVG